MRFGTFLSVFVGLAVIIAISVPVPGNLTRPRGAFASRPTGTRCLALTYARPNDAEWFPARVRLLVEPAPPVHVDDGWYRAEFSPEVGSPWSYAWRPVGPDSIDIAWYHSPVIRLPVRGDTLVGRIAVWSYPSLFAAMMMPDRGYVRMTLRALRNSPNR
jgi:hypothetical protein